MRQTNRMIVVGSLHAEQTWQRRIHRSEDDGMLVKAWGDFGSLIDGGFNVTLGVDGLLVAVVANFEPSSKELKIVSWDVEATAPAGRNYHSLGFRMTELFADSYEEKRAWRNG